MADDLLPECRGVADNPTPDQAGIAAMFAPPPLPEARPAPDLRLRVAEHGAWFVVRSNARRVRGEAIDLLAKHEQAMVLTLDFDGVQALTNGCADEMVAGLIVRQDDRTIRVANTNDEVADAIVTALARRELTVEGIPERALYAALAAREQDLHDDLQTWRERAETAENSIAHALQLVDLLAGISDGLEAAYGEYAARTLRAFEKSLTRALDTKEETASE